MKPQNMYVSEVRIEKIPASTSQELSDIFIRNCCFCEKKCHSEKQDTKFCQSICQESNFFCNFCIRHGFNYKRRKDVLILSFRPIFAQFYFCNYISSFASKKIYLSEIRDFIKIHQQVGLLNPIFAYDPQTMLWFVDFSKIGKKPKQLPLEEVYKTIINIISCFNTWETIVGLNVEAYFKKFKIAVDEFYKQRFRPKNKLILMPTLGKCGELVMQVPSDKSKSLVFFEQIGKNMLT